MDADETSLYRRVLAALTRWLSRIRTPVMWPWTAAQLPPDPLGVYTGTHLWRSEVDVVVEHLQTVQATAARAVPQLNDVYVSNNGFAMAQLARTENLLARIPDEVYQLIFAEIADGTNNGDTTREIAARVDRVLDATGSQRWPDRARVIAITEVNRARNAGTLAAAVQAERDERARLTKRWLASFDERVRPSHQQANGQTKVLSDPFLVGGFPLLFPGDPQGPADEVINCRCSMLIEDMP